MSVVADPSGFLSKYAFQSLSHSPLITCTSRIFSFTFKVYFISFDTKDYLSSRILSKFIHVGGNFQLAFEGSFIFQSQYQLENVVRLYVYVRFYIRLFFWCYKVWKYEIRHRQRVLGVYSLWLLQLHIIKRGWINRWIHSGGWVAR